MRKYRLAIKIGNFVMRFGENGELMPSPRRPRPLRPPVATGGTTRQTGSAPSEGRIPRAAARGPGEDDQAANLRRMVGK